MRMLLVCLIGFPAFGQLTEAQKVFDFQALAGLYAKRYAPKDWKQTVFGFDAFNISPWLDRVRATDNDLDFYELMVEYVSSLQDGHDAYVLPSNFSATLGLTLDVYDGKVLIDSINRTLLPLARFPFVVGDEIVSVDSVTAAQLLKDFAKYARQGNDRSTARVAASRIVTRPQSRMPRAIDLGPTAAVVVKRQTGATETYTIPWVKSGTPLTRIDPAPVLTADVVVEPEMDPADRLLMGLQTAKAPENFGILNNASLTPVFALPTGFVRRLGTAPDFFYSGTYTANGLRIGYIRIPTYSPSSTAAALTQFQQELAFFQDNTDGLVVDQMRNNGGDLCYGETIVSNLIPQTFRPMGYAIRATYEYLQLFTARLTNAQAANNQTLIRQYQPILEAVQAAYDGSQRITDVIPLCTSNFDRPAAVNNMGAVIAYRKPLIMLIDEFSVSTADSVPAMIQDNARGLLVGWRTNGMGGSNSLNIQRFQVGAYSEGDTGITLSLMARKEIITTPEYPPSRYIENVGVRPDVELDYMTLDNLLNNGRTFVNSFTDVIVQQIRKAQ
ncbi:MAG: hypothetical protein HYZ37_04185 [Candidatus Solibacter usitatus]|nr:hypothetical protein [Candidatus Solibacter usitatus]